jgi:hypothetical protein
MSGAFTYVVRLKQGATLALDLLFTDDSGNPINLATATSVGVLICDAFGNVVATPAVTLSAELGWGTVTADTTGWPYGGLPCQTEVVAAGITTISDTFYIFLDRGVNA